MADASLNPRRNESESSEDYKLRRKLGNRMLKLYLRGRMFYPSLEVVDNTQRSSKHGGPRPIPYRKETKPE